MLPTPKKKKSAVVLDEALLKGNLKSELSTPGKVKEKKAPARKPRKKKINLGWEGT